jgi:hypothetical protein
MTLAMSAVRAGLAAALKPLGRVHTSPDQLSPPCFLVGMPEVVFDQTFARGLDMLRVPVFAVTQREPDRAAIAQLDVWLSGDADGVHRALRSDPTLDGACQTLRVVDARPQPIPRGDGQGDWPAYSFQVEVYG